MSVANLPEIKKVVRSARARQLAGTALPRDNYPLTAEVCLQLVMELEAARGRDQTKSTRTETTYDCLVFQTCEGESERFHRELRGVDEEAARIFAEGWTRPPRAWEGHHNQSVARQWDLRPRVLERRAVILRIDRTMVATYTGDRDGRRVDEGSARRSS
jgi:hypothetical protein